MSQQLLRVLPLIASFLGCSPQIGKKCTLSTDCSQLGDRLCDTNQPDGYCTIFNCEPDQCPNSICVAFDPLLDPLCSAVGDGRWPRFERTYCLASCNGDGDCRNQYQCVDLSDPTNRKARNAQVVDLGAADGGLGYKVCMAATCGDGIKDGAETDVDCGGPVCPQCYNRQHCNNASDCLSGACPGGVCLDAHCLDGVKDGRSVDEPPDPTSDETDVDCGGIDCARCAGGLACQVADDCLSQYCHVTPGSSVCDPGDCTNGKTDGAETDVDCGGAHCQPCSKGQGCMQSSDCASGVCTSGQCGDSPKPGVCSAADAGPPWTPYSPDAGAGDGGDAGDGG
jgi:hypothetical protein